MELLYKEEIYEIIGICMEVHRHLGHGFSEIVYKDAIVYEFKLKNIDYQREQEFEIQYKDKILEHKFYADFVVFGKIILEVKALSGIDNVHIQQTLNYLKASDNRIGLVVNFGKEKLEYKRLIY